MAFASARLSCPSRPSLAAFRPAPSRSLSKASRIQAAANEVSTRQVFQVTLKKPMGLVLAERQLADGSAQVWVEEVVAGGHAEQEGSVRAGDLLTRCSATVLKAGTEGEYSQKGHGGRPYDNFEKVWFNCEGKKWDTVMAALGSNSERYGIFSVQLEFAREGEGESPSGGEQ